MFESITWKSDFDCFYAVSLALKENIDPFREGALTHILATVNLPIEINMPFRAMPWSIWLFAPLAYLRYEWAYLAWLFLSLSVWMIGVNLLSELVLGMTRKSSIVAALLGIFLFFPAVKTIWFGQISLIVAGFIFAGLSQIRVQPMLSGALLSVGLLKPHIFFPILAILTVSVNRSPRFIFGILYGLSFQIFGSLFLFPKLFSTLPSLLSMAHSVIEDSTPTLTSVLHLSSLAWPIWAIWSVSIFIYCAKKRPSLGTIIFLIIPLQLIFSPYEWSHDFVYLFPAAVEIIRFGLGRWPIISTLSAVSTLPLGLAAIPKYEQGTILLPLLVLTIWFMQNRPLACSTECRIVGSD